MSHLLPTMPGAAPKWGMAAEASDVPCLIEIPLLACQNATSRSRNCMALTVPEAVDLLEMEGSSSGGAVEVAAAVSLAAL
jgi:hypothetical protein